MIRDLPRYKSEIEFIESSLVPGEEFLVRLTDLTKRLGLIIPNGVLSTFAIDGIKYISFKVLELGPKISRIEISMADSEHKIYEFKTEQWKQFEGIHIEGWQKSIFDLHSVSLETDKDGAYIITHKDSDGTKKKLSYLQVDVDGRSADIIFTTTSLLFRNSQLAAVLFRKFFEDHPEVQIIKTEIADENKIVLFRSMIQKLVHLGMLDQTHLQTKKMEEQFAILSPLSSTEEFNRALKEAVLETPAYKMRRNIGFGGIRRINFDKTKPNSMITLESTRK